MSPRSAIAAVSACAAAVLAATAMSGGRSARAQSATEFLDSSPALLRWDAAQQGPLLIIDAQHTPLLPPAGRPDADLFRGSLHAVAAAYGRKLIALGTLTALAPTTMVVIGPPDQPPTGVGTLNYADALRFLLASLTPDQWTAITSGAGLPMKSLSDTQWAWAERVLPAGTSVSPAASDGAPSDRRLTAEEIAGSSLRLTRDAMLSVRQTENPNEGIGFGFLSFARGATSAQNVFLAYADDVDSAGASRRGDPVFRSVVPSRLKPGDIDLSPDSANAAILARPVALSGSDVTVGELIRRASIATGWELYADQRVAQLSVRVIEPEDASAVSDGDLLRALCWCVAGTFRRVGPADGPPAYVLTDDREGIGARLARIQEWQRAAEALNDTSSGKADEKIRQSGGGNLVGYAPDDPYALPTDVMRQVIRQEQSKFEPPVAGTSPDDDMIPVSRLPAAYQTFLDTQAQEYASQTPPVTLRTDQVRMEPTILLSFLVPGLGEVRTNPVQPDETLALALAPTAPPGPAPDGGGLSFGEAPTTARAALRALRIPAILAVAAGSPDDARTAVRIARRFGFARLWLMPSATDAAGLRDSLTAALSESSAAGLPPLPVTAVISLLKPPAPPDAAASGSDAYDRNVLGETSSQLARRRATMPDADNGFTRDSLRNLVGPPGDYLRFDTPAFSAERIQPVLEAASIHGLAGIALCDTAPPGFEPLGDVGQHGEQIWNWMTGLGDSGDFGYTPELRLAFLRREGYDPIDLSICGEQREIGVDATLPFFPDAGVPFEYGPDYLVQQKIRMADLPEVHWLGMRAAEDERLLAGLYRKVRAVSAAIPLYVAERSGDTGGPSFWASWDAPDGLPRNRQVVDAHGLLFPKDPRSTLRQVAASLTVHPDDALDTSAANLTLMVQMLGDPKMGPLIPVGRLHPDSFLFDLRAINLAQARTVLERAFVPAAGSAPS